MLAKPEHHKFSAGFLYLTSLAAVIVHKKRRRAKCKAGLVVVVCTTKGISSAYFKIIVTKNCCYFKKLSIRYAHNLNHFISSCCW